MRKKIILVSSVAVCSFAFAQNIPSKLNPAKEGLHADFMRFEKDRPAFQGNPVLFDEATQRLSAAQGRKLGSEKDQLGFETHRFQQTIDGIQHHRREVDTPWHFLRTTSRGGHQGYK